MKVIIPLAGKGTRLRPHTHTKPKPLIHIAGKPVLGHIIDKLEKLPIEEIVFITGDMEDQIKTYVTKNYPYKTAFIKQEKRLGDGHAISLAKEHIDKDVLVIFVDTLFDTDLSILNNFTDDGIVWTKEVEDYQRFGVVVLNPEGHITKVVEKPTEPISKLCIIGLYYFKDGVNMMNTLHDNIKKGVKSKGEFRLADAIETMITQGKKIQAPTVNVWADCGKPETLLETQQWLLDNGKHAVEPVENSVIIPPVYIEKGAQIQNSIIGPYVSIASGVQVKNTIIKNSIITNNAIVQEAQLKDSIIGEDAIVKYYSHKLNVGDHSEIIHENHN